MSYRIRRVIAAISASLVLVVGPIMGSQAAAVSDSGSPISITTAGDGAPVFRNGVYYTTFAFDAQEHTAALTGTAELDVDGTKTTSTLVQNVNAPATAEFPLGPLYGEHLVTVSYTGSGNFQASPSNFYFSYDPDVTTTAITASSFNDTTIEVDAAFTGTTTNQIDTAISGTATLSVDGVTAANAVLSGGTAHFSAPKPDAGQHTLVVDFDASPRWLTSTASALLTTTGAGVVTQPTTPPTTTPATTVPPTTVPVSTVPPTTAPATTVPVTTPTTATPGTTTTTTKPSNTATSTPSTQGFRLVDVNGRTFNVGEAGVGSLDGHQLNKSIVGAVSTPTGNGFWAVASDGGIFTFGDAQFYGSMGGLRLNQPIVGMATTTTGHGYWLVASDGGVFSFGDAQFLGSMGGSHLNKPIVGMSASASGHGYWFVASDGGVFSYGNAQFYGSMGGSHLNKPIVAMTSTTSGHGYWFVASDGGIFTYGDAQFWGSSPSDDAAVFGMLTTTTGGYYVAYAGGAVKSFQPGGPTSGVTVNQSLSQPIVAITH